MKPTTWLIPQRQVELCPIPTGLRQVYPESSLDKVTYVMFAFDTDADGLLPKDESPDGSDAD